MSRNKQLEQFYQICFQPFFAGVSLPFNMIITYHTSRLRILGNPRYPGVNCAYWSAMKWRVQSSLFFSFTQYHFASTLMWVFHHTTKALD